MNRLNRLTRISSTPAIKFFNCQNNYLYDKRNKHSKKQMEWQNGLFNEVKRHLTKWEVDFNVVADYPLLGFHPEKHAWGVESHFLVSIWPLYTERILHIMTTMPEIRYVFDHNEAALLLTEVNNLTFLGSFVTDDDFRNIYYRLSHFTLSGTCNEATLELLIKVTVNITDNFLQIFNAFAKEEVDFAEALDLIREIKNRQYPEAG